VANNKLKLLYIASNGRSGSTLLEMVLGIHSRMWTTGEFYVLPFEAQASTKPCGCGQAVRECPFWGPLVEAFEPLWRRGTINRFRDWYHGGPLFRPAELARLWRLSPGVAGPTESAVLEFGVDNERLLSAVLERAREFKGPQVTWLVDASKNIYRLMWLQRSGQFDLRVIHLVKDPRAFAYSISRRKDGSVSRNRLARATMRWNIENYLFDRLLQRHFDPSAWLRIRYEDLATRTEGVLGNITDWLGVPANEPLTDRFRATVNHGVAGNPMRLETGGIRLDERWREGLTAATQKLIGMVSFAQSRRYGYA
jgi:hypothetical protein